MTTPIDIVNQALDYIAAQTQIASFADVPAGVAAQVVYAPTVQLVLRQNDPDFARYTVTLMPVAAGVAVPPPWAFAYVYPHDCLRLRQLAPAPGTYDVFDPPAIRGNVAFALSQPGNVPTKIITGDRAGLLAIYTTSLVTEDQWDSLFEQAVVRQLADPLAMAIAGRPDFAKEALEAAARYEQLAEIADESVARSL